MSERRIETEKRRGQEFYLPLPGRPELFAEKEKPVEEKTALWVPYEEVVKCGFSPSETWSEVLVNRDVISILRTIARFGQTLPRVELEDDPSKQQVIFYTAIVCEDYLLWYRRAGELTTKLPKELLGDERLRGKFSIGVGGHKTKDDILSVRDDFLNIMIPLVVDEVKNIIGVNKGLLSEVEEEVGVSRESFVNPPKILGAFMDRRNVPPEDPRYKHPIGFVHLALPTIMEISTEKTSRLRFFEREIAWAGWVPLNKTDQKLEEALASPYGVDSWTEVFIKEFLPKF